MGIMILGYCSFGSSGFSRVNGIGFTNPSLSGWDTNFYPYSVGDRNLGTSVYYWNNINYSGGITRISDRRIKNSIEDTPSVLNLIKALKPRTFFMNSSPGDSRVILVDPETNQLEYEPVGPGKRKHFGLIAQEVKEAFEQSGFPTDEYSGWAIADKEDPDSQQAINLDEFIGILIKSVQELSVKVEELESRLS
jgi:Chaperone of endosialidase